MQSSATAQAGWEMPSARLISNSEVSTWLLCRRKYYYNFDLNLVPVNRSESLSRGILGHDVLAAYYKVLSVGGLHEQAVAEARKLLMAAMDAFSMELCLELDGILKNYWDHYKGTDLQKYEILKVEDMYQLPINSDFEYVFRFDLYLKERTTGKCVLMDHKFVYDFWNADKLALNPQFPKYVGAMRANGLQVDECILNQIRYRKIKEPTEDQLWRRSVVLPSNAKIRFSLKEQILASKEIAAHKFLPVEVRSDHALGVRNPLVCKYCEFKELCASEYDGGDTTYMIQNEYTSNTYGYNAPIAEEM